MHMHFSVWHRRRSNVSASRNVLFSFFVLNYIPEGNNILLVTSFSSEIKFDLGCYRVAVSSKTPLNSRKTHYRRFSRESETCVRCFVNKTIPCGRVLLSGRYAPVVQLATVMVSSTVTGARPDLRRYRETSRPRLCHSARRHFQLVHYRSRTFAFRVRA